MKLKLAIYLCLLFFSCSNEKQESTIVESIQQTGKLATVEYTLSKIIKANDNKTWYKAGDRKILLSAEASIKGGVDLQVVTKEDIDIDGETIRVVLPPPQILSVSIPPEKITVQYEEVSALRSRFSAAEREALLSQAETQIRRLADSLGILQKASENASLFMKKLLQQAGFKTVIIENRK